jgi:hypothetical protein
MTAKLTHFVADDSGNLGYFVSAAAAEAFARNGETTGALETARYFSSEEGTLRTANGGEADTLADVAGVW